MKNNKTVSILIFLLLLLALAQTPLFVKDIVQAGEVTFGWTVAADYDADLDIQDNWYGTAATTGAKGGILDSITVYLELFGVDDKVKCGIYNSDLTFLGVTNERTDGAVTGWVQFDFSEPKPSVTATTTYYIGAICDTGDDVDLGYSTDDYAEGMMRKAVLYENADNDFGSWTSENSGNHVLAFGTYTESAGNSVPTFSNPSPTNGSTGESLTPTVNVTVTDADGNQSICDFYTSTDGSSWTWRQQNTTVLNESIEYDYTQASVYNTLYYWKVSANDTHDNSSVIYHFTTSSGPGGTDYFVKNGGDDGLSGLDDANAWATIDKVENEYGVNISEGDNVYFNRGDRFYDEQFNLWITGGATDNPMVIGAYGTGAKPIFNLTGASQIACTNAVDNLRLENLNITGGTATYGLNFDNGCGASDIEWDSLKFYGDQNILRDTDGYKIENCHFSPVSTGSHGIAIGAGTKNGIIRNCTVDTQSKDGINFHFANDDMAIGDSLLENHLIENITITGATGDNAIDIVGGAYCYNVLIRNVTISSSSFISVGHEQGATFMDNIVISEPSGNAWSITDVHNLTVRNSVIYTWGSNGISTNDGQSAPFITNNVTFYNNNIISDGDDDFIQMQTDSSGIWYGFTLKNNIFLSTAGTTPTSYVNLLSPVTISNILSNWTNNMWWRGDGIGSSEVWDTAAGTTVTFTEWNALDEVDGDLLDDPELGDPANGDFSLNNTSPCIDAGAWLTQTDGSGTSDWITVDDANYFFAGLYNIGVPPYENILGDIIFVGDDTNLVITEINYVNESFKIDQVITWGDNEDVSLSDYNGSAPDIGAMESAQSDIWVYDGSLKWKVVNATDVNILRLSYKGDLGIIGTNGTFTDKSIFAIVNSSDVTIFNLSISGDIIIVGAMYTNQSIPSNVIWNLNDLLWLQDDGDLYLKGSFYEEI